MGGFSVCPLLVRSSQQLQILCQCIYTSSQKYVAPYSIINVSNKKSNFTSPQPHVSAISDPPGSFETQTHKTVHDPLRGLHYEPDRTKLLNAVAIELPTKWKIIGQELGIKKPDLEKIEREKRNELLRCYEEVFDLWERQQSEDKPYTWATLIQALRSPLVRENSLAEALKRDFTKH